jgi:uncharacterized protein (DUF2164 family)
MSIELTPQEHAEAMHSLKRYLSSELEQEVGDLRARLLLDYILKEIGPLAYNRGVKDAEEFFRKQIEDLPGTCFEQPLTFWLSRKRKPPSP